MAVHRLLSAIVAAALLSLFTPLCMAQSFLTGTLYDLKRTASGEPSKVGKAASDDAAGERHGTKRLSDQQVLGVAEIISKYLKKWDKNELAPFYRLDGPLYAANFMVPTVPADAICLYGNDADNMQPGGWVGVYEGVVQAPKSGVFRFIGMGDDFLAVQFDGKTVLQAGHYNSFAYKKKDVGALHFSSLSAAGQAHIKALRKKKGKGRFKGYELIPDVPGMPTVNKLYGGLHAGAPFRVEEGKEYPIRVFVSDMSGTPFGYVLFCEELTEEKMPGEKRAQGSFCLFRTNYNALSPEDVHKNIKERLLQKLGSAGSVPSLEMPRLSSDGPVWKVVKSEIPQEK